MSLITISEANIRYVKSKNTITTNASSYKKKYGVHPKWYVIGQKKHEVRIDTYEFEKVGKIEYNAWMYATNSLYWIFEDLGINQTKLSILLAEKSQIFNSSISWNSYLSNSFFNVPNQIVYEFEKSRLTEFVRIGTKIIYEMIKKGEINADIHKNS